MNNQAQKMEKPLEPMLPPLILESNPSIAEPKTLSPEELNSAREAALKIIKTHTKEEALKIFLGLVPMPTSMNAKEEDAVPECDDKMKYSIGTMKDEA